MAFSMYDINFKVDVKDKILCSKHLLHKQVEILNHAIEDLYYFEFIIDQIPMHDFIGKLQETAILPHAHKAYLWTHSHFTIGFNGDKIIYANITNKLQDPLYLHPVDSMNVTFTYSVTWIKTSDSYKERPSKVQVLPKTFEIHWLSIINSLALVLILNGFVAIIMTRVLKKDFAKYNLEDIEDVDDDENGWKIIHSDVFRYPVQKTLFCAILGVGSQFLAIISGVLTLAVLGFFNVHRHGSINTAAIILYALTSCISGFVSSGMYNKMDGERWVRCINLTSALFIAPFCIVWAAVNSIAWAYGSTQALPWETIFLLACTWAFLGYPLTIVGGVFGKNWSGKFNAPCRTKRIPREIPELPLYRGPLMHCFIGGFLPFSAISVELYYIFSNVWGRESYTLYGVLAIVFMILISLTASISVSLTYFQLNVEDYRWWWRSVYCAGSTGFFVFLYSLFYYFKRSNMSGFLQTTEFFGYTLLCCYVFFLTLGTVGFFASLRFVRYIYVNIKMD